jgi:hypothetical protein
MTNEDAGPAEPQDGGGDLFRLAHAPDWLLLQKFQHCHSIDSSPIGVSMGHIALTRMPWAATSSAALLVRPITPCLVVW